MIMAADGERFALEQPIVAPPGRIYNYNGGATAPGGQPGAPPAQPAAPDRATKEEDRAEADRALHAVLESLGFEGWRRG